MIVVSDTSPLNYLALIGRATLLHEVFGEVVIPPAVARELAHLRAPQPTRDLIQAPPHWLIVREPSSATMQAVREAGPRLGAGEFEAISLAKDLHAELLLTDERRATIVARRRHHLRVTGLLGVLELAASLQKVDLPEVIAQLESTTFRMPKGTVARMLQDDAARRRR